MATTTGGETNDSLYNIASRVDLLLFPFSFTNNLFIENYLCLELL